MRRIALLICLIALAAPADGAEAPPLALVPMLPLAGEPGPDIEALVGAYWQSYWRASGFYGFGPANIRVGRWDLDGDGNDELIILVEQPDWQSTDGKPLLVATWENGRWKPVGWGWGDEDCVFVTSEVIDHWRTVDAGNYLLRWTSRNGYERDRKPAPALP